MATRTRSKQPAPEGTEVRSRGILFAKDMIAAIRAGRKTQTRRAVSPQPPDRKAALKLTCPFGSAGDELWVREQHAVDDSGKVWFADDEGLPDGLKWRTSLHLPRRWSRLSLKIVETKIERLTSITPEAARAEGEPPDNLFDAKTWFLQTWDRFNADRGYPSKENPWVWAIRFEPVESK